MLPELFSYGLISIRTFWVVIFIAFLMMGFVWWKKTKEEHYDVFEAFDTYLQSVLFGVLVSRAVFVALHFGEFGFNLIKWFALLTSPGLSFLAFALASGWWMTRTAREKKWKLFEVLDIWTLSLVFGLFWLSLGVFLDGAGTGAVTSLPWGLRLSGVIEPRHPVALYTAVASVALFAYLYWAEYKYRRFTWYRHKRHSAQPGFVTAIALIGLGILQLGLSFISEPQFQFWGVSLDQGLYLSMFVIGLIVLFWRSGRLPSRKV